MSLQYTYSVIVPTYNEEQTIDDCLRSLVRADFPNGLVEIIVVDGESTDRTRDIVTDFSRDHEFVSLHTEYEGSTAAALNVGIEQSTNEVVVFVGGHSTVASDFFVELDRTFSEVAPDADVVGGVMVTEPRSDFERYVSTALRTPLGSSSSRFRPVEGYVDTVNFGAYRRYVIDDIGLVDTDLVRAEDYEFNVRVRKNEYKIYQNPDIRTYYRPRATLEGLVRQYFGNGFWKPRAHAKHDARFAAFAELPLLLRFVAVLAVLFGAWVFSTAALVCSAAYLMITTTVVARHCWYADEASIADIPAVTAVLMTVHVSFVCGFACGLATLGWR